MVAPWFVRPASQPGRRIAKFYFTTKCKRDDEGDVLPGRLHIPAVVDLFGEGSFDHPFESPWSTLLTSSNTSGNLVSGLRYSWSHLTSSFQDVATHEQLSDSALRLRQDISQAGFNSDGTVAGSATDAVTRELESARSRKLGESVLASLDRTECERWS